MRIAIVNDALASSAGGQRQCLNLAIELQKKGHEVEIFTSIVNYKKCFPELLKKVKINAVPYSNNLLKGHYGTLAGMIKMGRCISDEFDVINNHNFPSEWAVFVAKKRLEIPAVWMCNEPPFWFFQAEAKRGKRKLYWPLFEVFDKIAVRKSMDQIVVLSNMIGEIVKSVYGKDFKVVRSGVDIKDYGNSMWEIFKRKYGLENDFILLQVGMHYYKKPEDSIKAMAYLHNKYKNLKLILVGSTDEKRKKMLMELSKKLGIENKVLLLGPISDEELDQAYAACDIFLFPSFQSWSLSTLEAMVFRKPVIVSNKCGVSEIIDNYKNGIIVDHAKAKNLAMEIERLIEDRELRVKIGLNAYINVKENLSWKRYAENMEKIFMDVINER